LCEGGSVDLLSGAEHLRGTPDDLREDDAGVAARAHQRCACHGVRERRPIGRGRLVEILDDRPSSERQVRPRVAVRDRVDVEVVDPLPVSLERPERGVR